MDEGNLVLFPSLTGGPSVVLSSLNGKSTISHVYEFIHYIHCSSDMVSLHKFTEGRVNRFFFLFWSFLVSVSHYYQNNFILLSNRIRDKRFKTIHRSYYTIKLSFFHLISLHHQLLPFFIWFHIWMTGHFFHNKNSILKTQVHFNYDKRLTVLAE